MSDRILAELIDGRIIVRFQYTAERVGRVKKIPGAKLRVRDGTVSWRFPLEFRCAQDIKEAFPGQVTFSPELQAWGWEQRQKMDVLTGLSNAADAALLERVPTELPLMYSLMRPYQKSGAKFIATAGNPYVCDHPGLGKTWQVIAGIVEAGLMGGPKLVIAPKIALDDVWLEELDRFQDQPIYVADEGRSYRDRLMEEVALMVDIQEPFWLIVNPAMLTLKRKHWDPDGDEPYDAKGQLEPQFPFLHETWWDVVVVDEVSRAALANTASLTGQGIRSLSCTKRIATDGTPVRGRLANVWSVLNWLEPKEFKSKWRWAEQWADVEEKEYYARGKQEHTRVIGGIATGREEDFYKAHAPYILRRTKGEVLKELPPKMYFERWCSMNSKQAKQYRLMDEEAQMQLGEMEDEGTLNQTSLLAVYARLKQFAGAYCDVTRREDHSILVQQTTDSCKLDVLWELLEDLGITDKDYGHFSEDERQQVVIFSQFSKMVDTVTDWLNDRGVPAAKITGGVSRNDRKGLKNDFQAGEMYRAMCMTTTAGGVAITLDRASTVIFLDETWVPDDQEQAEDRVHRASRIHQVTVYRILTKGTIDEEIRQDNIHKQNINDAVMDVYRQKVLAKEHI